MEPYFKEGDQVLVSTLNFNDLKGPKKMRVEVRLAEEFSRKHPVFLVSLVKPYFQTGEDKFPSRKKNTTPPDIVKMEDSIGPVTKITKCRKIIINGKYQRQDLVSFENHTSDKDKWSEKDDIPDRRLHLRIFRASQRI
ncbi:hypothetical protein O181_053428 [Austropuccinia psidii MF-1]|uniref:Uncharacterized protein n=1 Tax=Austropuccinia psidii MF-1 TaxID=1389203 RepID=A0A9Q3HQE0_9BASI|nr:hypothetical protein [Austropuccinia psidii MF-1]